MLLLDALINNVPISASDQTTKQLNKGKNVLPVSKKGAGSRDITLDEYTGSDIDVLTAYDYIPRIFTPEFNS